MGSEIRDFFRDYGSQLAFGPAVAALLGSLYFSEIAGFVPCELCWYQRILMYPLAVIILVGIFNEDRLLPIYTLPFSLTGIGISLYHTLLQFNIIGSTTICSTGAACTTRYVNAYGFITIPMMALIAFTLITILMIGTLFAYSVEPESELLED